MRARLPRSGISAPRIARGAFSLLVGISLLMPPPVHAAMTLAPDIFSADSGFRNGQAQYDRGEFLAAARTWTKMAEHIPEDADNKRNRVALYEYIGDAYHKALQNGASDEIVREALQVLTAYSEGFVATYPGEPLPVRVARHLDMVRTTAVERDVVKKEPEPALVEPPPVVETPSTEPAPPPPLPKPAPEPVPKPWKGLAIGGGISLGGAAIMVSLVAVGAARAKSFERQFDDACSLDDITGKCADIDRQGKAANTMQIAGLVAAPLLLGAGVAMLVVAMKRKSVQQHQAFAPLLGPRAVGLVWLRRF